jgi:cephalosporin hydroxylase
MELVFKLLGFAAATALGYYTRFCRILLLRGNDRRKERFVSLKNRSLLSDLAFSRQVISAVQSSKWNDEKHKIPPINWKGVLNMKDPFELAIYPLLLWELKPATIIELGSFNGGSAAWLADMLEIQGIDGRIYSFDIDIDRIEASHPRVEFRKADTNNLDSLDLDSLASLPHPWLVIEDAHENVYNVLRFFGEQMMVGDYFIVEDTNGRIKYREFKRFVLEQNDSFLVDTRYTDLFGYNVTWNPNAYLKKVK